MKLFQLTSATWPDLAGLANADDVLLLRQDAVHLLRQSLPVPAKVYVLAQDLAARGLACPPAVTALDDSGWVQLCIEAEQVILCRN